MLFILLPAYNEELSIDRLFQDLGQYLKSVGTEYKIIACDDGSTDKTYDRLVFYQQTMPVEIIRHKINRGLGETARDLFERAAELSGERDIILRLDCDNTHDPEYFGRLVAKIDEGYDVVIASRFAKGGGQKGIDRYRAFISYCATIFMRTLLPVKGLREYTCGFRAYRASLIKKAIRVYGNNFIQLMGLGFTCTLEKVVKLNLLGARFADVPFVLRYDKKKSPSKMVSSITTLGYFIMAILYHWPWGGWRSQYGRRLQDKNEHDG